MSFFTTLLPAPPRSTPFPYTTLFRSQCDNARHQQTVKLTSPVPARPRSARVPLPLAPSPSAVVQAQATSISRSEEHTSELQSHHDLVCRLLLEKKKR